MRPVAIVAFAQSTIAHEPEKNEVELLMPVVAKAVADSGIPKGEIGFTCSGSCDYLIGAPFSFVSALDSVGAWPPIEESHVEMDAAWALYEAWVRLQHGDVDSALVYGFGKPSMGDAGEMLAMTTDPYTMSPLCPDPISTSGLAATAYLNARGLGSDALNTVSRSALERGAENPYAIRRDPTVDVAGAATIASPLRTFDVAPVTDGAAAIVLAAGELAERVCARPAWITGIDHRVDPLGLGVRDLATVRSAALAAAGAGVGDGPVDVAELHAQFSHEVLQLKEALGLRDDTVVNPSGGPLVSNPLMATGLIRFGEAAARIWDGSAQRAVAHAAQGPALQQNLVAVLSATRGGN